MTVGVDYADFILSTGNHVLLNTALALLELCKRELFSQTTTTIAFLLAPSSLSFSLSLSAEITAFDRIDQVLPFIQNIPSRL